MNNHRSKAAKQWRPTYTSPAHIIRYNLGSTSLKLGTATSQTLTVNGALTIGDGVNIAPVTAATYNPTIGVAGNPLLNATGSLVGSATSAFTVAGNWTNKGTFTPNSGTITLSGTNQTLSGSTTFYNLSKNVTSADTLMFAATTTQTITNALSLNGYSTTLLTLASKVPGLQWKIDPHGSRVVDSISVSDSNNINATAITCMGTCTDGGGNTNWSFVSASSSSLASSAAAPSQAAGSHRGTTVVPPASALHSSSSSSWPASSTSSAIFSSGPAHSSSSSTKTPAFQTLLQKRRLRRMQSHASASAASSSSAPANAAKTYHVISPIVNLRKDARIAAPVLRQLHKGDSVTKLTTVDVWAQVLLPDGEHGYVILRSLGQ